MSNRRKLRKIDRTISPHDRRVATLKAHGFPVEYDRGALIFAAYFTRSRSAR